MLLSNQTHRIILILAIFILSFTVLPVRAQSDFPSQPWIRVAITTGSGSLTVTANGANRINSLESSESLALYDGSHTYSFSLSGGQVRFNGTDFLADGFTIVCADESGRIEYNGRTYRGIFRVVIWDGSLAGINVLPLEQYLWGVVPCEVPSDWPVESLRAQAVAARTYSLRALEQYPDRPFDVYSGVADQVYRGAGSERERTTNACRDTIGQVCTFLRTPIIGYFHSAAGGWTASGAEMFGRDLPYLRAVPSRDSSVYRWTYEVTSSTFATALRNAGWSVGTIQRVWVHRFSPEGRADEVKIVHSDGVLIISGSDLRRALGPPNLHSTYFTIEGQAAPEIPAGSDPAYFEPSPPNPFDNYSFSHPGIMVPVPTAVPLESCVVVSQDGITNTNSLVVIGFGDSIEYLGGYIWIAKPVRVSDLSEISRENIFSLTGEDNQDEIQVIDDPGSGVGVPSNGEFVFVGHGNGHGVGMSQHGARILAEDGWEYSAILKYFYTGVEIERFW